MAADDCDRTGKAQQVGVRIKACKPVFINDEMVAIEIAVHIKKDKRKPACREYRRYNYHELAEPVHFLSHALLLRSVCMP